ncbi:hypothetical protein GOP47_0012355 [Adiantum capillus-veneris]|uniref:Fe/B12 periplasmic-binding domain-containing protein n=1 Tax=Adiantum capillus-veneris TaxID=13818 RepID=A0A9D4ZEC8_ADICA|nr:hypothetical protein GOP47_0012355 [Adiantum capillus-veneris]
MPEQMVGPSSRPSSCRLRIVCLFQGAVDALCALGLQNCLVGRSHQCNGPASALTLPCVSSCDSTIVSDASPQCNFNNQEVFDCYINWELLQELKPDLIFSPGPSRADNKHLPPLSYHLAERECRVVSLQSHTVEDIFQNLETIASYCGVKKEGAKLVTLLQAQWKSVKQITPQWADGMPYVNVAFLSSVNPLTGCGYWVPEIISCAGGLSAFGSAGCPSKSLSLEDLAQTNPDVIVYLSHRLHMGHLASELSWLFTNKVWKNLKAIKANRFFLIDANRFFIDSAPNVISSTEILTEIFHGFGYGHDGKGFIRWQFSTGSSDEKMPMQDSSFEKKLPAVSTNKGAVANTMDVDKHEVGSSASQVYPKYVTNVYEVRKPAVARESNKPHRDFREKPDVWDGELVVLQSKKNDALKDEAITPEKVFQADKTHLEGSDEHAIDWHRDSVSQMTKELSASGKYRESAQVTLGPMNCFSLGDQAGRNIDLRLVQTRDPPLASSHRLSEQSALDRVASLAVHRYRSLDEDRSCDKQLISKIWAFTESAAEMRSRSMPLSAAQKVFHKSVSLPVSRRTVTNSNANNKARLSAEILKRPDSFSNNTDDEKALIGSTSCRLSAKDSFLSDVRWDKARAMQSLTARKHEEKHRSNGALKRRLSHSVPSSPKLDLIPRISRHIRDLVLKSIVELKHLDCLLLSGGLASSILAEAVPLVHSKGFRIGFTVVAGPAATDKTSAAVAAKCKGMQHAIIGEGEKGFAVFLLAKELAFLVETLKSFDPLQVRNLVPIAAALREAKNRGFEHVVTGDGLDELLFRDKVAENDIHLGLTRVISRSAVVLGEALGVKVIQPFSHPKLVRECKAFIRTCGLGSRPREHMRAIMREAFPEVSAACSEKAFNEVESLNFMYLL